VPELGLLTLDDRAGPVIGLEVEALVHRRGDPDGLVGEEVEDAEVGDVLLGLVELDAERVGAGIREVHARADVLDRAVEGIPPVPRRERACRLLSSGG
jgi:hypothetical protein